MPDADRMGDRKSDILVHPDLGHPFRTPEPFADKTEEVREMPPFPIYPVMIGPGVLVGSQRAIILSSRDQ